MTQFAVTGSRSLASGCSALLLGVVFATCLALPAAPGQAATTIPTESTDQTVVAAIGQEKVTEGDLIALDKGAFDQQQQEYDRELRQLQLTLGQARHDLLQQQLDKLLDSRALAMEAKARGVSTATLLAEVKVPAVTDAAIQAFYESNRSRTTLSFDQLHDRIRQYLADQNNQKAMEDYYQTLRSKYAIHQSLEPYRLQVVASGPARGPAVAPVTIVEFGDFQCPYCKESEATLATVLAKYPRQVRLVFRELPLTQVHPNAMIAAQAGVCADEQGKFWAMHDAMYADQKALDLTGLAATATRLGMDAARLTGCMKAAATAQRISGDVQAAGELGIGSTPYFFVDGRPVNGSVPPERFESLISDELVRLQEKVAVGRAVSAPRG